MYLQETGQDDVYINFFIEYEDGSYILLVDYEYMDYRSYKYISQSWEKIDETIIEHSNFGCNKVLFTPSIQGPLDTERDRRVVVVFSQAEVPLYLYKVLIRRYLRDAYGTDEEKDALLKGLRDKIRQAGPVPETIVIHL